MVSRSRRVSAAISFTAISGWSASSAPHVGGGQGQQLGVGERLDARRAGLAVEHRQLAEDVARAERGEGDRAPVGVLAGDPEVALSGRCSRRREWSPSWKTRTPAGNERGTATRENRSSSSASSSANSGTRAQQLDWSVALIPVLRHGSIIPLSSSGACVSPDVRVRTTRSSGRGDEPARLAAEAGLDQGVLEAGADHRLAVEVLDRELRGRSPSRAASASSRDRLRQRLALELDEAQDAAAAALDVEERLAVAEQHVGAGGAARAPAALPLPRFGQGSAAPYGLAGSVAARSR